MTIWFHARYSLLFLLALILSGCNMNREKEVPIKDEIIIGLNPSERSEDTQKNAEILADLIARKIEMPVHIFVAQDYSGLVEALRARTIDFAFLAPVSYVHAERIADAKVLLKAERRGSPYYFGSIVVRKDSPYYTIDDLKGKQIAWVDPSSASGHIFPKAALIEAGYPPDSLFAKEVFAGGHDAVLLSVINGTIDAGATYANDTLGISGSWTQLESGGLKDQIRPIFFSQPIPGDNIATSRYMQEHYSDLVKRVTDAIATMHKDPEGAEIMQSMYHVDAMIPATSEDYEPVRNAARLLNLDMTGVIREDDPERIAQDRRNRLYSWLLLLASAMLGLGLLVVQTRRRKKEKMTSPLVPQEENDQKESAGSQFALRGIHVQFEDRRGTIVIALDGVTLNINKGEFIGVIGPSGAGKSTLLRLLNRTIEPTAGKIYVDGRDVTHIQGKELLQLRRKIGFIFQQFNLIKSLSVLQNVLNGRLAVTSTLPSLLGIFRQEEKLKAEEALMDVGLEEKVRSRAADLSGGQQQRVAIARALAQEPEAILADEPTASLDPVLAESILSLLQEINQERNITIIANLHSVELSRRYAGRIIGLRTGQVVFDGSPTEITEETIRTIYQ